MSDDKKEYILKHAPTIAAGIMGPETATACLSHTIEGMIAEKAISIAREIYDQVQRKDTEQILYSEETKSK